MLWFDRHRRLRDQLSAYLDGELDESAVAGLEGHLAECDSCRLELEQLRAAAAALRELPQAEAPRSFTLSPDQVAPRPAPAPAGPLAIGMRMATAGVAAALAVVLVLDLGGFTGDGVREDAPAPAMEPAAEDRAAEQPAPADEPPAEAAPDGATGVGTADTPAPDTVAGEEPAATPAPDDGDAQFADPESPAPDEPETVAPPETVAAEDGGIDALTAAQIGLAAALGVLVAGSLVLGFIGRKR